MIKNQFRIEEKTKNEIFSSVSYISDCVEKVILAKSTRGELSVDERIILLEPILDHFNERKEELALLISKEVFKPIKESLSEVEKSLSYFDYYLKHAKEYLAGEITFEDEKTKDILIYEPVGVACVIVPWNYPFMLAIRGIVPNLLVGNTVIFKHSENSPMVGKFIEEVFLSKNLPNGTFAEIYGDGEQGNFLVHQNIDLIWFTGSSSVGQNLYKIAGEKMIPAILEMGGSNPAIVFEGVDLDYVAKEIFNSRFKNCGQYCNAVKRVIIQDSIFEEFVIKLKKHIENKIIGDPLEKTTDISSMINEKQRSLLISQVEDALSKGAKVITGGEIIKNDDGFYYKPTILIDIKKDMLVWKEEVFGPVLPVISFSSEENAVEFANDTQYGLGAQIFSVDKNQCQRIAKKINTGMVDINGGSSSKYCNPFGGNKKSGMGREHGRHGFQELCKMKLISEKK